jgi:dienelactone hydrolase
MSTIDTVLPRETYRCAALLLTVAALLGGCGSDKKSNLASPFTYDASKPLALESTATSLGSNGVEVSDVSFAGPGETRLSAYLATPESSGRHPAVVYAHGAGGDRMELLSEATEMARTGAVTLTLEMIYSPARAKPLPEGMAGVRENSHLEIEAVREVARAVDLLRSLPSVDADRIGYVGWSAGARMGAIVAGVDHRIRAFDLIAGGGAPVSDYVKLAPIELRSELEAVLAKTDSLHYVSRAAPSALLFQVGRADEIVPEAALKTLAEAGSEPKEVRWYDSGHVPSQQAWADSRSWLADHLDLTGE